MRDLNLPNFEFKIKELNGGRQIFDEFRKKFVSLTPEEWVRQRFLRYLVNFKGYPVGLMSVEKELIIHTLKRRPDAVAYNRSGQPRVIFEFKSPDVVLNDEVFFQAAMYNKKLGVPYLVVSNGIDHFAAKVDHSSGKVDLLDELPDHADLD